MYYCTTKLYYNPFLNMLENADFDNLNKTRNKITEGIVITV